MRLLNRIAVITGAAGGIGEEIAHVFVENGASVVVADLNEEGVKSTADDLQQKGASVLAVKVDVSDVSSVQHLMSATIKQFGRIDILGNIAGVGSFSHFNDVSPEEFDRVMKINVYGSFYCAQAAARQMVKQKYGRIINVASIAGARAGENRPAYGTSKAAVIGLTQQGARDLARDGITVNAIAPGPVDTPLTKIIHTENTRSNYLKVIPAGRYGTVSEMADAALFLAGEAAGYVNGHILFVDGGYVSGGVAESDTI